MINKIGCVKECECNFCHAQFYYTDDDLVDVNENSFGFICPECGNEIEIYKINDCRYPESFFHFSGGKKLSNNEIQEYINKIRTQLETSNEDYDYNLIASGDTIVFATKDSEDGISIYVAKNYYECDLI